jgi:hypothetical protein
MEIGLSREDVLSRYRRDRAISVEIQTGALKHVSESAMLKQAKRLGLSDGKSLIIDDPSELTLLYDLLVHTVPRGGRSRAIDRYAHAHRPEPGSDQERVLAALQAARFSIVEVKDRHATVGLMLRDLLRNEEIWLVDEHLETSARPGIVLGTRIATPDAFAITCGVLVSIGDRMLREIANIMTKSGAGSAELADDSRFVETLYQLVIALAATDSVQYL